MSYNSMRSTTFVSAFALFLILGRHGTLCSKHTRDSLSKDQATWETSDQISLAFVFDRTGSMYDDLVQVRAGAAEILKTTIESGETAVKNYILVPFRDPVPRSELHQYCGTSIGYLESRLKDVGPALQTDDPEKFLKALNEIYVRGGKDCPEMSVTAIKQALELSSSGSVIYVFTDAEAKDYRLLPEVIKLIKERRIRVNFVLTGDCGLEPHEIPGPDPYETISTVSTGQVVSLNKSDVNKIWKFVEISINPKRKSIFSGDKFTRGQYTYVVVVHKFIDQIIVTASGENVQLAMRDGDGRLVYPEDDGVQELFKLKSAVSFLIRFPKPGNWSFTLVTSGRHTLRVEGISNRWKDVTGEYKVVVIPDNDECKTGIHNCKSEERCLDLPNGFTCVDKCAKGFQKTAQGNCIDVNECSQNSQVCGDLKCVNTRGSYRCEAICREGFRQDRDGFCTDINECSQYSRACRDRECVNTIGGYRCETKCPEGFRRSGRSACTDINECSQNSKVCGNRKCINTHGSYHCEVACPIGFQRGRDGFCADINECSQKSKVCGDRECVNTRGSYRCTTTCPKGFRRRQDDVCSDIDECLETPGICQYACENTAGSFRCVCPRGTRLDSDNLTCLRINRCPLRGHGRCQHQCNPITGRCECPPGYKLHWDEISCLDINECFTGEHTCGRRRCFNTLGKYHCLNVSCPPGYFLNNERYCTKQCYYHSNQCPGLYSTVRYKAVSIPCYLPLNTDFLYLEPYIPQTTNIFHPWICYCSVYFYPIQGKEHLFGVYKVGQIGRLYNRVVFDKPGLYEFQVVSDYLNSYRSIVSRTMFHVFVDVSDHPF